MRIENTYNKEKLNHAKFCWHDVDVGNLLGRTLNNMTTKNHFIAVFLRFLKGGHRPHKS
jgi:hypothetical protein